MIWASCHFDGCELGYLPALNPGACEGRTWFIEFTGDVPILLVVEGQTADDALVVVSNHPEFGEGIHVAHVETQDEPDQVPGVQFVRVHGDPASDLPYAVRYYGEGYPVQGIDPRRFARARWN